MAFKVSDFGERLAPEAFDDTAAEFPNPNLTSDPCRETNGNLVRRRPWDIVLH